MFEIGEYIVYGVKGVCRIEDITHIDISGADKDRLYYVLAPVGWQWKDLCTDGQSEDYDAQSDFQGGSGSAD